MPPKTQTSSQLDPQAKAKDGHDKWAPFGAIASHKLAPDQSAKADAEYLYKIQFTKSKKNSWVAEKDFNRRGQDLIAEYWDRVHTQTQIEKQAARGSKAGSSKSPSKRIELNHGAKMELAENANGFCAVCNRPSPHGHKCHVIDAATTKQHAMLGILRDLGLTVRDSDVDTTAAANGFFACPNCHAATVNTQLIWTPAEPVLEFMVNAVEKDKVSPSELVAVTLGDDTLAPFLGHYHLVSLVPTETNTPGLDVRFPAPAELSARDDDDDEVLYHVWDQTLVSHPRFDTTYHSRILSLDNPWHKYRLWKMPHFNLLFILAVAWHAIKRDTFLLCKPNITGFHKEILGLLGRLEAVLVLAKPPPVSKKRRREDDGDDEDDDGKNDDGDDDGDYDDNAGQASKPKRGGRSGTHGGRSGLRRGRSGGGRSGGGGSQAKKPPKKRQRGPDREDAVRVVEDDHVQAIDKEVTIQEEFCTGSDDSHVPSSTNFVYGAEYLPEWHLRPAPPRAKQQQETDPPVAQTVTPEADLVKYVTDWWQNVELAGCLGPPN
uniref:Uncharacterized protein n=1 Tax=Mycena chlorophos TaxID=658473 RepID=A0ABQ0KZD4_MYCCL|nr:predicted protein [Mycena chlorophos]